MSGKHKGGGNQITPLEATPDVTAPGSEAQTAAAAAARTELLLSRTGRQSTVLASKQLRAKPYG